MSDDSKKFRWKGQEGGLEIDISGFLGTYEGEIIPIFKYFPPLSEDITYPSKAMLLVNRNEFPKLTQYSVDNLEKATVKIVDQFYFAVQSFSDDDELVSYYLDLAPDWLTHKGDTQAQRKYLESKVILKIFERFELKIDSAFSGVIIPVNDSC